MIVTQPPIEISSHGSPNSSEILLEVPCSEEDEDIHICGTCKYQFNDIFVFIQHKSEGSCVPASGKNIVAITVPSNVPSVGPEVFSSVASTAVPDSVFTRVAKLSTSSYKTRKHSSAKGDSPPPLPDTLHVSITSLSAEPSSPIVPDQSLDLRRNQTERCTAKSLNKYTTQEIQLRKELLEQHGIHFIEDQDISDLEEPVQRLNVQEHQVSSQNVCGHPTGPAPLPQGNGNESMLDNDESHNPSHTMNRRCEFLDIEDVEVATLLANHLANEPTLHMYPSVSESPLSYSNIQSQLELADSSDGLHFVSNIEIEEKCLEDSKPSNKHRPHLDSIFSKKSSCDYKPLLSSSKSTQDNTGMNSKDSSITKKKRKVQFCHVDGCGYQGCSTRDLNRHMRRHTGERPFKCPQCEKEFSRGDKLANHLRIHSGTKSFKCDICGYASVDHYGLVRHMRTHNDERPYKCQICSYGARTTSHLKVHLRTHTGDHPYVCKVNCGKAFKTSSDLHRHMRTHSGVKPFPCPHCSYRCALKSNLQTHVRLTHSTDKSLKCPKCDVVCHSRRELKKHEKSHADNLHQCSQCDFVSVTKLALKNHCKTHSTDKRKSHQSARSKRGVKPLVRKRIVISKRSKPPSLGMDEESSEYNSKAFNCEYCSASFWREDAMEVHLKQHVVPLSVSSPAFQDPVLADSADSREGTDSNSMDSSAGLAGLATLASFHNISDQGSSEHQPAFLYRYMSGSHSNDTTRNQEILNLNTSGPQYVTIQSDQSTLVDALNSMQYVLPSPLGSLDDSDNATPLLC